MCFDGLFKGQQQPSQTIVQQTPPPRPPAPPNASADAPSPDAARSPELGGRPDRTGFSSLIIPRTSFPGASKNVVSGAGTSGWIGRQ